MTKDELLELAKAHQTGMLQSVGATVRLGQSVFVVAHEYFPEEVDKLRGGPVDPHYSDANIDGFCKRLGITND